MKRFLPLLAVCALLLPVLHPAQGADVSLNFFYDNLGGGNWYEVSDYGYVWQPDVATSNSNWRPYMDGYWAYTDQGWTWVSYEDFGWATYHYGRWARLADYGWVWVPGTDWAPAWVSWRTGGDYVGWAPLPPAGGGEVVYEGRPITGHVDVEFGIGPAYYNFVDLRYFGEPVLTDRIFPYDRNVTIINNTVNVTNITYNNSTVYNYGPDYATVSRYSVRPIQRLKLERRTADPLQAVKNGSVMKKEGNTLVVAAPQKLQKATAQLAPKQVKSKIEQPKVEKGWANTDPGEKAKLEQKFKSENVKEIPKPNIQPAKANANVNAEAAGAGAAVAASPAEHAGKGKQKGTKTERAQGGVPAATPAAVEQGKAGKDKNRAERGQTMPPSGGRPASENQPLNTRADQGVAKHNKANQHEARVAPAGNEPATAKKSSELKNKPQTMNPNPGRENEARARVNNEQREQQVQQRKAQERQRQQMRSAPVTNQPPPPNASRPSGPGAHPQREAAQSNAPGQQQKSEQEPNQPKGKGKKKEGEATPPPQ